LQELDPGGIGHANIRYYDVKNLRLEPSPGRFPIHGDLDAMAFLAERNLQQFADGSFVIHD
jgi:hypothetical protein